jgi:hypothetical protein
MKEEPPVIYAGECQSVRTTLQVANEAIIFVDIEGI